MSAAAHVASPRHPLTGKQFTVRAKSAGELAAYLAHVHDLKSRLRLGLMTADEVDKALRRLRKGVVTVERAGLSYARRKDIAENTRRRVKGAIGPRGALRELAALPIDSLDGPTLAKHFRALGGRMDRSTIVTVWRTLRAIVRYAAERGEVARVPWGTWRPPALGATHAERRECARSLPELGRLITGGWDVDKQLAVRRESVRHVGEKIAIGAAFGLRQGELAGLRFGDVYKVGKEWHARIVRQYDEEAPKTPTSAAVVFARGPFALFVDAAIADLAKTWLPERPHPDAPLFPRATGGHMAHGSECLSTEDLRAAVTISGLNNPSAWSPHSLRDTFATIHAQEVGGDLAELARRTRHKSIASLVRYLRSFERSPLVRELQK
jgi:integrase